MVKGGPDDRTRRQPGRDARLTAVLDGMRAERHEPLFARSAARLQSWAQEHAVPWIGFSGGKDSVATALLVERVFGSDAVHVVFFDSGLEFPETISYIGAISARRGWRLTTIPAVPSALDHLVATGYWDIHAQTNPQPFGCSMHELLIERPSAEATERFGPVMAWGLRAEESKRRRMLLGGNRGIFTMRTGVTRMAPVWDWKAEHVTSFIASRGETLCPVYARMVELGEPAERARLSTMVDASALEFGRFAWLRRGWPAEWAKLCAVLPRLREFG
jgi:phosphoadenosine phosphosulfate reductase